ncbi:MAG: vgrg protein [Bacillota bacterium]|nr:vgrg protein [Bacillota bacterium]
MTTTKINSMSLTSVSNDGTLYSSASNQSNAEAKVAEKVFQQVYELMLEKSMSSSPYDVSESAFSEGDNSTLDSSDMSQILGTLLDTQQESLISQNGASNVGNALDLVSKLNLGTRYFYAMDRQPSSSQNVVNNNSDNLGILSARYESNGNPGDISDNPGDPGGKSYGAWQFSSKMGSLNSFLEWSKNSSPQYYQVLIDAKHADGGEFGSNFDNAWTRIANADKSSFLKLQQDYVRNNFYENAAQELKSKYSFDIDTKSQALKNVLWSTVVQHGVRGALNIFSKVDLKGDEKQIISEIYQERQKVDVYFSKSSESIKHSVYNRFTKEKSDALSMLEREV